MANCDMCGNETKLCAVEVEGTMMNVCSKCAGFGNVIRKIEPRIDIRTKKVIQRRQEPEIIEMIVEDYAGKIRKKRESMGMKQKEFARFISERESLIHSIETNKFEPSLKLARKLEKLLRIKLVEEIEDRKPEAAAKGEQTDGQGFTLGDFIKKR